jgi:tetratricopeptide (TPR) repeat protein
VASFNKALAIKPDYAKAHYNLGNALRKLGKLDEAVASYCKALAISPGYDKARCNLGNTFQELGRLDEAVASYHKVIANNPQFTEAWNNLKLATKACHFSKFGGDRMEKVDANGLNDSARATVGYAIHQSYLAGFMPHEADESYEKIIAALPPTAEQTIPINGVGQRETRDSWLPDKVVALLRFGRSGTGLLHSLIDGHPEISTLPSVYLRGYFNEGVWDKLSADGWRGLPERFADIFAVMFDARISRPIPSRLGEPSFFIGKTEGLTSVGENRDEFLSLDRKVFFGAALRLMEKMETIDPMSFLLVIHAAFEEVIGSRGKAGTSKRLCFYHIHNPDEYAKPNFLRYASDARLLMTVREPIQNCESSLRDTFEKNNYDMSVNLILGMLFAIDQIPFRMRESVGLRLEDLKSRPEAAMQALCAWLGVENSPTLYEMTAQGKKWWGDPSSPDYGKDNAMSPFDDTTTKRPVGAILGEKDQFVLRTLFYPFSVRFGYQEADPDQFQKDLKEIWPLFDDMLDFEKAMTDRANIDPGQFKKSGAYQLFRAGLVDRWQVLNEFGDYPYMLEKLAIP